MVKQRISLTVDDKLLQKVDKLVDGLDIKSRSDFVEKILKKYVEQDNTAVILCGGDNFYVENTKIPRPLVPILDKKLVEYNVEILRRYGFSNIFIIGKKETLTQISPVLEEKEGVNVMFLSEEGNTGSAGVLLPLEKYVHTRFLVIPGDCLFDFDIVDMLGFHKSHGKSATLAVHSIKKPDRPHYRLAWIKSKGNVLVEYSEKSGEGIMNNIQGTGIYMLEPSIFNYLRKKNSSINLGDLVLSLIKDKQINSYLIHGDWYNIHTNEDINDASLFARSL